MLSLPNGCTCSNPSVFPKKWKTVSASTKIDWRIQYYFKDPEQPKSKLIVVKRMNRYKSVSERREITKILLSDELEQLYDGYNPVNGVTTIEQEMSYEIEPGTPFIAALKKALTKLKISEQSITNIKSALTYIEKASNYLGYSNIEVCKIRRKNLIAILEACPKVKKHWSAQLYNHYRAYLMQLFTKLVQLEAIEANPVNKDLPKESTEENLRELITPEERATIKKHFKNDKYYQRFIEIFFHSGARPIELLRLKEDVVNLEESYYKTKVRKRKKIVEEKRPIKKIVQHLWQEILEEIKHSNEKDIFLFGKLLKPSRTKGTRDYITKKWHREVKIKLGIDKDLYALKHTNLDETSAILDAEAAARQAGHKSTVITMKHYLRNEDQRQRKKLTSVNNKFA